MAKGGGGDHERLAFKAFGEALHNGVFQREDLLKRYLVSTVARHAVHDSSTGLQARMEGRVRVVSKG